MARSRRFPKHRRVGVLATLVAALAAPAFALTVPEGTDLQIRLKTRVSNTGSHDKDPVEAVVIQPVTADGRFAIPAGAAVHGRLAAVTPFKPPDGRAVLALRFTALEFGAVKQPLAACVRAVDNAREKVDGLG